MQAGELLVWDATNNNWVNQAQAGTAIRVYDAGGTDYIEISHDGTDLLVAGTSTGKISIQPKSGEDSLVLTADGAVSLYHNNILRFNTNVSGIINLRSDTSTDSEIRRINFDHQDATNRGTVGYDADDVLAMRNKIHGGNALITAEDAGGTARTILLGDPDARTTIVGDTELYLNSPALGFYTTTPIAIQTGVAVTAAGIHAAIVALGLFTA